MIHKVSHHTEQVAANATSVSYSASGVAVFLGLTVDEWGIMAAIVGILGVVSTFCFNAWFRMKYGR